jgi:hypothetical protein
MAQNRLVSLSETRTDCSERFGKEKRLGQGKQEQVRNTNWKKRLTGTKQEEKREEKKKAQMGQTHPNASKNPLCISSLSELARLQYPRSKSDLPAILLITVQLT